MHVSFPRHSLLKGDGYLLGFQYGKPFVDPPVSSLYPLYLRICGGDILCPFLFVPHPTSQQSQALSGNRGISGLRPG